MYLIIATQSSKNHMMRLDKIEIYGRAFVNIWLIDFHLFIYSVIYSTLSHGVIYSISFLKKQFQQCFPCILSKLVQIPLKLFVLKHLTWFKRSVFTDKGVHFGLYHMMLYVLLQHSHTHTHKLGYL